MGWGNQLYQPGAAWCMCRHRGVELSDADRLLEVSTRAGRWQCLYFETV